MGSVYQAEDTRLGRQVALKIVRENSPLDAESLERFQREVQAASRLSHPYICTVYDAGEDGGLPFLAMELLDGQTLAEKINSRPVPTKEILYLGIQIADALAYAHEQGFVHRAVKPCSVFVTSRGDAKLLDFGIAKKLRPETSLGATTISASLTFNGNVIGTMPYMSPEQVQGKTVDARTDIFSLGAVLYEMATGQNPFAGDSVATTLAEIIRGEPQPARFLNPGLPDELERIIGKALEKAPADCYQSAKELMVDPRRLVKQLAVTSQAKPVPKGSPWLSNSRANLLSYETLGSLGMVSAAIAVPMTSGPVSGPLDSQQITFVAEPKQGPLFRDGSRLHFTNGGVPSEMAVSGGTIAPMRALESGMRLMDISSDASEVLVQKPDPNNDIGRGSLWVSSTLGGTPSLLARWPRAFSDTADAGCPAAVAACQ